MTSLPAWRSYLVESDAALRRSDVHRGVAYTPDPKALTIDAVREYVTGFGWSGVGAREVTGAVCRDERGVKRALRALVEDGTLRVEEQMTRGPQASKRKVYYAVGGVAVVSDLDVIAAEEMSARGLSGRAYTISAVRA